MKLLKILYGIAKASPIFVSYHWSP